MENDGEGAESVPCTIRNSRAQILPLVRRSCQKELDLIRDGWFTAFPPRLAHQPIFSGFNRHIAGAIEVIHTCRPSPAAGEGAG